MDRDQKQKGDQDVSSNRSSQSGQFRQNTDSPKTQAPDDTDSGKNTDDDDDMSA